MSDPRPQPPRAPSRARAHASRRDARLRAARAGGAGRRPRARTRWRCCSACARASRGRTSRVRSPRWPVSRREAVLRAAYAADRDGRDRDPALRARRTPRTLDRIARSDRGPRVHRRGARARQGRRARDRALRRVRAARRRGRAPGPPGLASSCATRATRWSTASSRRAAAALGVDVTAHGIGRAAERCATLHANGCVAIVADQDAGRRGVFVDFFGQPASTPPGPAELCVRTGASLVVGYLVRGADGSYAGRFVPPIEPPAQRRSRRPTCARSRRRTPARSKRWIRDHPEQWLWTHRRWKTAPRAHRRAWRVRGARSSWGSPARCSRPRACRPARAADALEPQSAFDGAGSSVFPLSEARVRRVFEDVRIDARERGVDGRRRGDLPGRRRARARGDGPARLPRERRARLRRGAATRHRARPRRHGRRTADGRDRVARLGARRRRGPGRHRARCTAGRCRSPPRRSAPCACRTRSATRAPTAASRCCSSTSTRARCGTATRATSPRRSTSARSTPRTSSPAWLRPAGYRVYGREAHLAPGAATAVADLALAFRPPKDPLAPFADREEGPARPRARGARGMVRAAERSRRARLLGSFLTARRDVPVDCAGRAPSACCGSASTGGSPIGSARTCPRARTSAESLLRAEIRRPGPSAIPA